MVDYNALLEDLKIKTYCIDTAMKIHSDSGYNKKEEQVLDTAKLLFNWMTEEFKPEIK